MEQAESPSTNVGQALEEAIRKVAPDNRINCAAALALARKFSVSPGLVGDIANRLAIKIIKCQLGCF